MVLLLAVLGACLLYMGSSAPPTSADSDDDSDIPLAPPEDEEDESGPRLEEPDEVTDYPVENAIGGPPLTEPMGPTDKTCKTAS